jgi:dihydrodipicolinate synthase/N-acetylneuraminate lyase
MIFCIHPEGANLNRSIMAKKISGIFAPITTCFQNEKVSLDHLKENIKKYGETPLSGFLVLGSNGENKSLTDDEKIEILENTIRMWRRPLQFRSSHTMPRVSQV